MASALPQFYNTDNPECRGVSEIWWLRYMLAKLKTEPEAISSIRKIYMDHPIARMIMSPYELGSNALLSQVAPTYLLIWPEKLYPALSNPILYNAIQLLAFIMGLRPMIHGTEPLIFSNAAASTITESAKGKKRLSSLTAMFHSCLSKIGTKIDRNAESASSDEEESSSNVAPKPIDVLLRSNAFPQQSLATTVSQITTADRIPELASAVPNVSSQLLVKAQNQAIITSQAQGDTSANSEKDPIPVKLDQPIEQQTNQQDVDYNLPQAYCIPILPLMPAAESEKTSSQYYVGANQESIANPISEIANATEPGKNSSHPYAQVQAQERTHRQSETIIPKAKQRLLTKERQVVSIPCTTNPKSGNTIETVTSSDTPMRLFDTTARLYPDLVFSETEQSLTVDSSEDEDEDEDGDEDENDAENESTSARLQSVPTYIAAAAASTSRTSFMFGKSQPIASSEVICSLEAFLWQHASLVELATYFNVNPRLFYEYTSIDHESLLVLAVRMNCMKQVSLLLRVCPILIGRMDARNRSILQYLVSITQPERMARIIAERLNSDEFNIGSTICNSAELFEFSSQRALLSLMIHDIIFNNAKGIALLFKEGFNEKHINPQLYYAFASEYAQIWGYAPSTALMLIGNYLKTVC